MGKGHPGLPKKGPPWTISKAQLIKTLAAIDAHAGARKRVLRLETSFRDKIATHIGSLLDGTETLARFSTSPFVFRMRYCLSTDGVLAARPNKPLKRMVGRRRPPTA